MARHIKYIIIHCTAGPQTQTIESIQKYWSTPKPKGLGWKASGYHRIIEPDGTIVQLANDDTVCNGVAGYNANSLHVSYIGGVDKKGKAVDNRTPAQQQSMWLVVQEWKNKYPNAQVLGHRDFSKDKNGNGIIDPWERIKECPSFDVKEWWASVNC